MEFKKGNIGSKVYVKEMKRFFTVNDENKEIFVRFGYFNLFEYESTVDTRGNEHNDSDPKRTKRAKSARIVPVQVHARRDEDSSAEDTTDSVE